MSATFYNAALVLHITGITLMAGISFIDAVAFRAFCRLYATDTGKGQMLEKYLNKLQRFLGTGMLLILASGVIMMVRLHEVWGAQLWFRIKMGLLLLIILNGLGLRRVLGTKLQKMIAGNASIRIMGQKWNRLKRNLTIVQLIQLLLFLFIFTLSVFKFN